MIFEKKREPDPIKIPKTNIERTREMMAANTQTKGRKVKAPRRQRLRLTKRAKRFRDI